MLAMKTWGVLLLILVAPLIAIGGVIATGIDRATAQHVLLFAAIAFGGMTAATTAAATSAKPDLSKGIDEQAITRYGVLVGTSAAFGLGTLTFVLAANWPLVGLALAAAGGAWFALWIPPRLRLMTAQCSIVIDRDVRAVFALMSDFRTMVKWYPGTEAVDMVTPEPIGPGTRFSERGRLPTGEPVTGMDQIVEFEPNKSYSSTTVTGGMKNLDVVTFEPVGAATRVALRSTVELPLWLGLVGVALFKSSLAGSIVTMREAAWARAKQLLESDGQATP
jgi:hypothetical protein